MLRSQLEAKLNAKQMQLQILERDLDKINNLIRAWENTKQHLLLDRSNLLFEIDDLKDQMEDE